MQRLTRSGLTKTTMGRIKQEKPEDFRDRVIDMVKRGLRRADMIKELGCGQLFFNAWFMQDFPCQRITDLKMALGVRTPNNRRNNKFGRDNPQKYNKPQSEAMTDEERELMHERVREAEQDYLPRTVVPVRIVSDEEWERLT